MARTMIQNPTSAAVTLPFPYHAIIPAGQGRIVADTKANIILAFAAGGVPVGLVMTTQPDTVTATVFPVTATDIPDGVIGGAEIANIADSTAGAVSITPEGIIAVSFADVASNNVDLVMPFKAEVFAFTAQKRAGAGGAANTLRLFNLTDAITNALDMNVADQTIVRAGTIDDAFSTVAAGGTLRFAMVKSAGNAAALAYAAVIKRA